jgi:hypothetical protein
MLVNLRRMLNVKDMIQQKEQFRKLDTFFHQIELLDGETDIFDYFTLLLTKNPKFNLTAPLGNME